MTLPRKQDIINGYNQSLVMDFINNAIKNRGFTLVEILIAVALFSLVMASSLSILAITAKNNYKASKVIKLRSFGDSVVNVIHRILVTANAIQLNGDTQLSVSSPDGGNYTITCDNSNNTLISSYTNSGVTTDTNLINTAEIDLDRCKFICSLRSCSFSFTLVTGSDTQEVFFTNTTFRNEVFE